MTDPVSTTKELNELYQQMRQYPDSFKIRAAYYEMLANTRLDIIYKLTDENQQLRSGLQRLCHYESAMTPLDDLVALKEQARLILEQALSS